MSNWHPLLAAREPEPGTWYMVDSMNQCYGVIQIVRVNGQISYRLDTWDPAPEKRRTLGRYRSLRDAAMGAHHTLRSQGMPGVQPRR